jgi:ribulose-5-phosphate 4-epimerase/fuculose-1-phosphate aldolase
MRSAGSAVVLTGSAVEFSLMGNEDMFLVDLTGSE